MEFWEDALRLLEQLARTARFGTMRLFDSVNYVDTAAEEQFSAVTVDTGDGAYFVSYRGTDSTLIGWKEDFMQATRPRCPPSAPPRSLSAGCGAAPQKAACRVGGHSKGGNLAVYAAAHTPQPVQARLEAVYNNDGPGFCAGALDETGYAAVRERIRTFVPQTSIVGMLLDHEERYTVVRSRQVGLLQHDPFSWQVEGPDFVRLETVTSSSRFLSLTLKNWVASMDRELAGGVCGSPQSRYPGLPRMLDTTEELSEDG
ncbi:MAG: Mbeg1-like protein [Oscillospiraceae bacterium]